ncbi:MAG: FHA domain-containing protein, partial [Deltaproteobacteria bacterium]|nr:FHA domain-containing protein [Deltaproteobacteria bacterium]
MAEGIQDLSIAVRIHRGGELVDEKLSAKALLTIGSSSSADIVLEGEGIDSIHATIELNDEQDIILSDKGSAAGVSLNGKRIKRKAFVEEGDRIEIGGYELSVALVDESKIDQAAVESPVEQKHDEVDGFEGIHEDAAEYAEEAYEDAGDQGLVVTLIPETTPGERKGERVLEVRGILWGDTLYKV